MKRKRPAKPAKFIQLICRSFPGHEDILYALDGAGVVWELLYGDPPIRWCEVPSEREYLSESMIQ